MFTDYRIDRDLGHRLDIMIDVGRFAHALAVAGRAGTAAQLLSRAEALCEELGVSEPRAARRNDETLTTIHTQLDDAAFAEAWEEGGALTPTRLSRSPSTTWSEYA